MKRRDFIKNCLIAGPAVLDLNQCLTLPLWAVDAAKRTLPRKPGSVLSGLQFRNSGTVNREMQFSFIDQPMAYGEGPEQWNMQPQVKYLYQVNEGKHIDPPSGMRSSVPLGGLGSGTVELRADGSFWDWNIYNNSPAAGPKIQIDDTFFAIWSREKNGVSSAKTLRTHPPENLPSVAQIDYAGAFPVSRLQFKDPNLPLRVELFAYSEFRQRDSDGSATPAAIFTFLLHNPSSQAIEASVLMNVRNYTEGRATADRKIVFERDGKERTSGTIAVKAQGQGIDLSATAVSDLHEIWKEFLASGNFRTSGAPPEAPKYGALAAKSEIAPGETRAITFVLAWYLPYRPYKSKVPGNYYTKLFSSAEDVADRVLSRLDHTGQAIDEWQRTVIDNSLPPWLQDALINSVATMSKTGMRFEDGSMMQWESFSCSGLNPLHIDFYRVLPYAFFFPDLEKRMLVEHGESQQADGFIPEQLTTGCFTAESELGQPGGRQMGDSETCFLLCAWQIYSWTGDKQFLDSIWERVKKAAQWQLHRSAAFALPRNLINTYDWWKSEEKDLVSYNAFLHLAALLAAEKLAQVENDEDLLSQSRQAFSDGQKSLVKRLWTGSYFRSWWMDGKPYPDALHADTLYGQLWAFILDLGLTADPHQLEAHLRSESTLSSSPYGLKVMRRADPEHPEYENAIPANPPGNPAPKDNLVWQAGSLDWCSLHLYMGGDVQESLNEANKIVRNWTDHLRDQWNYTDLTTAWDGYPWCNSHYARQVILWSIPLALSGQRYFAPEARLTFDPKVPLPAKLPFFTPACSGTIELDRESSCRLAIISGALELRELRIGKTGVKQTIQMRAGESRHFVLG